MRMYFFNMYMYMRAYYILMCAHIYIYIYVYVYVCMYIYTCIKIHVYISYMYIHIYAHEMCVYDKPCEPGFVSAVVSSWGHGTCMWWCLVAEPQLIGEKKPGS